MARRHVIQIPHSGAQIVFGRRRLLTPGRLFWLAILGWFGWVRLSLYVHDHKAAIGHALAVGVPLTLAAVLGVTSLIFWLAGRRRAKLERAEHTEALLLAAYTPDNDGSALERQTAALMARDGWEDVQVCGGSGDLGADVTGWWRRGPEPVFGVVQCKCYDPDSYVGSKDLQAFAGTCYSVHEADVAVFVTTASGFHPGAVKVADRNGILLVPGEAYGRALAGHPLIPPALLGTSASLLEATQPLTPVPAEEATA